MYLVFRKMIKKIVIHYFPAGIRYVSWLFPVGSIWLVWEQYFLLGLILLVLFLIIQSTRYITIIDPERKVYSDFVFFLWMKLGLEQSQYQSIRGITIGRSSETQHVRSRIQDRQFNWTAYTATLHFDDDRSLDLVTSVSLETVKKEARVYAEFLGAQFLAD